MMGVLTTSTEKSEDFRLANPLSESETSTSSSEESRLLPKKSKKDKAEEKLTYPKSIFFIIGNEFCERFTYYGLRAVLTIYLTKSLLYSEDTATAIFHAFAMLAYFTPLLGAIIADSFLGKFKTILYLSILYCIGTGILSFGTFPDDIPTMTAVTIIGLVIIGFGTGGIKPCVSAFGGDQFKKGQELQLERFFSLFYLSINLGSVISQFITPILREDVHCLGKDSCYPLAFGVPAILMAVALIFFVIGKPWYTIKPPEGNIALKVSKCVCYALGKKIKSSEKKRSHWLDHADDKYDKQLINDIKILFHVLVLYIPLPVFWCLFDQQGSRWTLQATRMNGDLGFYEIKPDQVQVLNPILIVAFIPLFEYIVYPLLSKCNILKKPLQRITIGGLLAAVSFIVAALVELNLESAYPVLPETGKSQITVVNNSPCVINIKNIELQGMDTFVMDAFQDQMFNDIPKDKNFAWNLTPINCSASNVAIANFNTESNLVSMMITVQNNELLALSREDSKEKSGSGFAKVSVFYSLDQVGENTTLQLRGSSTKSIPINQSYPYNMSSYEEISGGRYKMYILEDSKETYLFDFDVGVGGVYFVNIYHKPSENSKNYFVYTSVSENSVSILHQIPQYAIITAGEIMFSITGLEFSYSQAPASMKSVIQALWLLTVAFGNVIVIIIAEAKVFEKQSYELFFFGGLMAVDMVIFAILAYFYKYVTHSTESAIEQNATPSKGVRNEGYEDETDFNK